MPMIVKEISGEELSCWLMGVAADPAKTGPLGTQASLAGSMDDGGIAHIRLVVGDVGESGVLQCGDDPIVVCVGQAGGLTLPIKVISSPLVLGFEKSNTEKD